MTAPYRVLVTGSRDWPSYDVVWLALDAAFCQAANARRVLTVVHGACPTGADAHTVDWATHMIARDLPVKVEPHPAKGHPTQNFGPWPGAGPRRNRYMVSLGANLCLAFLGPCTRPNCRQPGPHDSHGASGCADLARTAGIPVKEIRP
ncbi:MAG: DUF2493 domain-containing protein [Catenulispora sp.]|nr:DUF2493 domain-containing protein [Catenulispora sp.]